MEVDLDQTEQIVPLKEIGQATLPDAQISSDDEIPVENIPRASESEKDLETN